MPIQFTPQFFSQPTPTSTTAATASDIMAHNAVQDSEHKKYSLNHGTPKYSSPFAQRTSPLSNASQHYAAEIDWTHHEVVMQDGSRAKFGKRIDNSNTQTNPTNQR